MEGCVAIYKNKVFQRFARKNDISDAALRTAAQAVIAGNADADLGGGVYKQRVARDGAGRSGGFRTLLVYKIGGHAYFVYGFAKSKKGNIDDRELEALKAAAKVYAGLNAAQIAASVTAGELIEVSDES
jgi:hypothetical protein